VRYHPARDETSNRAFSRRQSRGIFWADDFSQSRQLLGGRAVRSAKAGLRCAIAALTVLVGLGTAPPAAAEDSDAAPNPWAVGDFVVWANHVRWAEAVEAAETARLVARWGPVHDCEQPGNWYAAGPTAHGYFEGGLGIHVDLYRSIAGHSALLDSPLEQMRVAEIALARVGRGAWACPVP
jgi:hypothetical protein